MSFESLSKIRPIYILPKDPFAEEVLIPCLRVADSFKCIMGFFTSSSFCEIAPGLSEFLDRSDAKMELIISPFVSESDHKAMEEGVTIPSKVLEQRLAELLGELELTESALVKHTLACFAYLISTGRLNIKIGLKRHGQLHGKIWLFRSGEHHVAASGSGNMTSKGLTKNWEQMRVDRSWIDATQAESIRILSEEFRRLWDKHDKDTYVVDLPDAIAHEILRKYKLDRAPSPEDFLAALEAGPDHIEAEPMQIGDGSPLVAPQRPEFKIPEGLDIYTGDFAHQGKAVDAWLDRRGKGLLEMATGSGKTITALAATIKLIETVKPLFIVIAVPYRVLAAQWKDDCDLFGLNSANLDKLSNRNQKFSEISRRLRNLRLGVSEAECIIITHDLLCDPEFHATISKLNRPTMLIADEVHNLGSQGFLASKPEFFQFRLGLSATPIRQYDQDGTAALFDFFGGTAFEFGLREAIGRCLVPYDYHIHLITLTADEADEWKSLTAALIRTGWRPNSGRPPDPYTSNILRKRRLVVENASGKLAKLRSLLIERGPRSIHHSLIYATDKDPEQLLAVNRLLNELGILFHQVTDQESGNGKLVAEVLKSFSAGERQVLTAKRVLDEGVNIPEILSAYIVASTTVERQWTQRRGRILRKCRRLKKDFAELHDFVVVPPMSGDDVDDTAGVIAGELRRAEEFAALARNAGTPNGPLDVIQEIFRDSLKGVNPI